MPRTPLLIAFLVAVAAALSVGAYRLSQNDDAITASLAVSEAMSSDTSGYARATDVRPFRFPDDHGPHPDYKTEWWYYTGNLTTDAGRHFGYELTLFRIALAPPDTFDAPRTSDWATDQLYMAHFGLTDVEGERFYNFERFSRGAAGLAGAQAAPFRVWLEDWQAEAATSDVLDVPKCERGHAADARPRGAGRRRRRPRADAAEAARAPGRPRPRPQRPGLRATPRTTTPLPGSAPRAPSVSRVRLSPSRG